MARSSPQSFEKRQRERRKQQKREEKFERRLIRNEEKRIAKAEAEGKPIKSRYWWYGDETEEESTEKQ